MKLLQKSYFEKIKVIYIDPPYNTGKDFVYKDDFNDTLKAYKEQLNNITTNTNTDGRFHSNWLNMMYSRLKLAKNLLRDDGVIFISIDDNEAAQLKLLCDEIFGSGNFITQFIWEKTQHFGRQKINYYSNADYILCYAKNVYDSNGTKMNLLIENFKNEFDDAPLYNASNPEKTLVIPKEYAIVNLKDGVYERSDNDSYILLDKAIVKDNKLLNDIRIKFKSRWTNETLQEALKKGDMVIIKSKDFSPRIIYANDKISSEAPKQIIFTNSKNPHCAYVNGLKVGTNQEGSSDIINLLGGDYFSYPKPKSLIMYLINLLKESKDDIILDFFSGSATTAHAVMQLNAEDGGNRKYILVQVPEPTDTKSIAYQNGYKNICEIGLARIKKSSEKIKQDYKDASFDDGVKVFYLDSSNISEWSGENITQENLFTRLEKIKQDRSELDLVYEFILKQGYSLTSKIEYKDNKYFIKDYEKTMIICLKECDIDELLKYKDCEIIIKDDLLNDDKKLNALENLNNIRTF